MKVYITHKSIIQYFSKPTINLPILKIKGGICKIFTEKTFLRSVTGNILRNTLKLNLIYTVLSCKIFGQVSWFLTSSFFIKRLQVKTCRKKVIFVDNFLQVLILDITLLSKKRYFLSLIDIYFFQIILANSRYF